MKFFIETVDLKTKKSDIDIRKYFETDLETAKKTAKDKFEGENLKNKNICIKLYKCRNPHDYDCVVEYKSRRKLSKEVNSAYDYIVNTINESNNAKAIEKNLDFYIDSYIRKSFDYLIEEDIERAITQTKYIYKEWGDN